jgi:hypothetical protein
VKLAQLWHDLEDRLPSDRGGRMIQRIHPDAVANLHVSVATSGARRSLELEVASAAIDDLEVPSATRGIQMIVAPRDDGRRTVLALELADRSATDLFTCVCIDVAAITASASDDADAVSLWTGRFVRWRRFLEHGGGALSPRAQRGLYAELWTIRELLAPCLGYPEAVAAWKGPERAPRDFESSGVAVEVKASAANEPQVVPIHGERQLDDAELDALFMVHLSLEVLRDAGDSLPAIVESLRTATAGGPAAGLFEDRLLSSGYADMHRSGYLRTGYALRRTTVLSVTGGFPRLTEADLPDGVGSVRYALAIDACRDFEVEVETLTASFGS